ncbi:MAG: oxygenase MpaB family protein, partial [Nocardioidaceae bacterium]
QDAAAMVRAVRAVHETVAGATPDGRPYAANDPHLLGWVHAAEIDSFLRAHQRFGHRPLDAAGQDGYVADTARVAEALGVLDPPRSRAELAATLARYRPELAGTPAARQTARFLVLNPPLPLPSRGPYAVLTGAAVGLLPWWARLTLRLPYLPGESVLVRPAAQVVTRTIRWALSEPGQG